MLLNLFKDVLWTCDDAKSVKSAVKKKNSMQGLLITIEDATIDADAVNTSHLLSKMDILPPL